MIDLMGISRFLTPCWRERGRRTKCAPRLQLQRAIKVAGRADITETKSKFRCGVPLSGCPPLARLAQKWGCELKSDFVSSE